MNALDDDVKLPDWLYKTAAALLILLAALAVGLALVTPREVAVALAPKAEGARLVVVETESCIWCRRFREQADPAYRQSRLEAMAPLTYIDLAAVKGSGLRLSRRVTGTPTFVLADGEGREVARLDGYPGRADLFLAEIERLLPRLEAGGR